MGVVTERTGCHSFLPHEDRKTLPRGKENLKLPKNIEEALFTVFYCPNLKLNENVKM
jgi:hypothetical protein